MFNPVPFGDAYANLEKVTVGYESDGLTLNLGDTYALTGETDKALAHYDEALEVDRTVGVRRNLATALQGR